MKKPKTDKTYHDDYRLAQQLARYREKILLQKALNDTIEIQRMPYAVLHLINSLNQIVYKLYGVGGYKFSYSLDEPKMVIDHGPEHRSSSIAEQEYRLGMLNMYLQNTCEKIGIPYCCKFIPHGPFYHLEMIGVLYLEHSDQLVGALTI